jgi:hypothetical protein
MLSLIDDDAYTDSGSVLDGRGDAAARAQEKMV